MQLVILMGCMWGDENDAKSHDSWLWWQLWNWLVNSWLKKQQQQQQNDWFDFLKQSNILFELGLFPHGLFAKLCTVHFENTLQERKHNTQNCVHPPPADVDLFVYLFLPWILVRWGRSPVWKGPLLQVTTSALAPPTWIPFGCTWATLPPRPLSSG